MQSKRCATSEFCRWFLTHPDVKPEFHPNKTTLQWFNEDYDRIRRETDILECTLRPGEVS